MSEKHIIKKYIRAQITGIEPTIEAVGSSQQTSTTDSLWSILNKVIK